MDNILDNQRFADTFRQLAGVTLNPRRHTAANALEHSEAVAVRAAALARANRCSPAEARLLEDLGRAHDIGKVTGTARPERSLVVLRDCGVDDPALLALVKWHDTSLPWYLAMTRGQPPTDKAWRRLAAEVDLRLLALFMVADRVDAPPGWRRNAPTVWFLAEARKRGLVGELSLDLPDQPSEVSAGGALVREQDGGRELLVVRVRQSGYELPKGGIEWDELPADAAVRETCEETGIGAPLVAGRELGHLDYPVGEGADRHWKRVRYFALGAPGPVELGPSPAGVRERRWIRRDQVGELPLIDEGLRPLLAAALD
jgi:ADP-ribose pyrophosphatase YjhB (NUDIX family)